MLYNNCDFFNVEFIMCFGVKFLFVRFVFCGENFFSMDSVMVWSEWYLSYLILINNLEDGFWLFVYVVILEFLFFLVEFIRKKKWIMGLLRGVKLVILFLSMR